MSIKYKQESEENYQNYGKMVKMDSGKMPTFHYLYPKTLDDAAEVCDMIKSNRIVHVDLSDYKGKIQRIIDCMGGMIFALDGKISRSSDKVFIITTRHVNIEGERSAGDKFEEEDLGFTFKKQHRKAL
jgi:cell division inhibitor SepF